MSAAGKKSKYSFDELSRRCQLRPIRTRKHHKIAVDLCDELTDRHSKLTQDEQDYLTVLTELLIEYEESQETEDDKEIDRTLCTPRQLVKFLMENNKLSQIDLAPQFGSASRVSDFLKGKRELSKSQIVKLADRFKVSPALFLEETSTYSLPDSNSRLAVSETFGSYSIGAKIDDDQSSAVQVNFRWTSKALSRVKRVADAIGMPYQAYIKQTVFRQVIEDEKAIGNTDS